MGTPRHSQRPCRLRWGRACGQLRRRWLLRASSSGLFRWTPPWLSRSRAPAGTGVRRRSSGWTMPTCLGQSSRGVTFYGADLRNASFKEAILSGSEFDGADIEGADFTDALLDDNKKSGVNTRDSLLCDLGGMERLEKLDEASFNRLEILDTPVGTACSD